MNELLGPETIEFLLCWTVAPNISSFALVVDVTPVTGVELLPVVPALVSTADAAAIPLHSERFAARPLIFPL
jgi:hypothetical protein